MKKVNNFHETNVQPQRGLRFCLIFCQFDLGVAYKIACKCQMKLSIKIVVTLSVY